MHSHDPLSPASPSDVPGSERSLVVRYLTLMPEYAPQRMASQHGVCAAPRYVVRSGIGWRAMRTILRRAAVPEQSPGWLVRGCAKVPARDLRPYCV